MVEIESLVYVTEVAAIVVVAEKKKDLYWQLIGTSRGKALSKALPNALPCYALSL